MRWLRSLFRRPAFTDLPLSARLLAASLAATNPDRRL